MMKNPVVEDLVCKLRDPSTDAQMFREILEEIGVFLGYEIGKELKTVEKRVTTVLDSVAVHEVYERSPVLVCVLRAGVPLYNGLQRVFPLAESGFIGAMRDEETLKAEISYVALPDLKGKDVVLIDTMIATAGSVMDSIEMLEKHEPRRIFVVGVIASSEGVEKIKAKYENVKVFVAAVDSKLNDKGYIVPGLGDAGDRCFGKKV